MKETVVWFAVIGVCVVAGIIFTLLHCFAQWAVGKLDNYRWKKKYKNRFNRSPTAECFCYEADPHLFDIDKLEEKEDKNENSKN